MSEETDAPQGGAEGVDTSAAVENTSEATTDQTTGAEETGQADDAGEATEEPKRVPWFQKRIDEVTARKYEAEREAAYWRGIAEGKTPQQVTTQPEAAALPTLEQFDYDEGRYQTALTEHIRKETEKALDQTLSKREMQRTDEQKTNSALTKLHEASAKRPDFMAAISGLPANEAIRDFINEDPNAVDVLYQLGKDPEASARFHSLPIHLQAIELGRRSAAPKATSRTIAPPPPETVAGLAAGMSKAPEQMTQAEFNKWREDQEKASN